MFSVYAVNRHKSENTASNDDLTLVTLNFDHSSETVRCCFSEDQRIGIATDSIPSPRVPIDCSGDWVSLNCSSRTDPDAASVPKESPSERIGPSRYPLYK